VVIRERMNSIPTFSTAGNRCRDALLWTLPPITTAILPIGREFGEGAWRIAPPIAALLGGGDEARLTILPPCPQSSPPLPATDENRSAVLGGTVFCVISALAYAASNVCMRQLTVMRCDSFWAVTNRELTTAVIAGACLLYQASRGRPTLPPKSHLLHFLWLGLLAQLVGAMCMQWALAIVGLAVTIPSFFGARIAGGAGMGHAWLGETVSNRSKVAIAAVLISLALLGKGVSTTGGSVAKADAVAVSMSMLAIGVAIAVLSGMVAGVITIVVRHLSADNTMPLAIVFAIPLIGVVSLAPICVARLGISGIFATPWRMWALMASGGVFNFIGFLALAKGLQRAPVVYVNVISVLQVAVAGVAGVLIFAEPMNLWLILGIGIMTVGIVSVDRPAADEEV
jgi:drug/metabolite transporter, DME family